MLRALREQWWRLHRRWHGAATAQAIDLQYEGQTLESVFSDIYARGTWGRGDDGYFSGSGSHDAAITDSYVRAVRSYLRSMPGCPRVVDLGCGDFHIGAQLVSAAGSYLACDVVGALIERNRSHFAGLGADFRQLDIVADALPRGDVAIIRQVLQHLSNAEIAEVVPKLHVYPRLIVSEHRPVGLFVRANRDKPHGPGIRLRQRSMVDITKPPFGFAGHRSRVLHEVPQLGGVIRTTVYERR
ncbi:MAG: hypothetical protein KDG50_11720 [Chromatiales bacterium]|nr:hypothetical protein [Chromatiales bacterium]